MDKNIIIQVFSCAGDLRTLKMGDIILAQHLTTRMDLSLPEAKMLLTQIEQMGYLKYDKGGINPTSGMPLLSGWHITPEGMALIKN